MGMIENMLKKKMIGMVEKLDPIKHFNVKPDDSGKFQEWIDKAKITWEEEGPKISQEIEDLLQKAQGKGSKADKKSGASGKGSEKTKETSEKEFVRYPYPGQYYQHYKGGMYEVISLAEHSETQERMVVYKSLLFGSVHVRPLSMWFEEVTSQEGHKVERFRDATWYKK